MRLILAIFILLSFSAIGQNNKVTLRIPGGTPTDISGKLNISDTASMLENYVRSVYRKAGSDSVFVVTANGATFAFKDSIGGGGVTTLAAIGTAPNANGATITGSTLTLQPASASFGGVVTTGAQTFTGIKTFSSPIRTAKYSIGGADSGRAIEFDQYSGIAHGNAYGAGYAYNAFDYYSGGVEPRFRFFDTLWSGPSYSDSRALFLLKGRRFGSLGEGEARFKVRLYADNGLSLNDYMALPAGAGASQRAITFSVNAAANTTASGIAARMDNACNCLPTVDFYGTNYTGSPHWRFQDTTAADLTQFTDARAIMRISGGSLNGGLYVQKGSVTIGATSHTASAKLAVSSTTQGFLPPRMTAVQAEAITSPAEGLMVYVNDVTTPGSVITTKGWWGYDGTTWVKLN